MNNNIETIKAELLKIDEELKFNAAVKRVYSRPKNHYNKLTASMKKAAHQTPSSLECFKEKNMYYSDKQVNEWIKSTEMFENFHHSNNNCDWD